MSERGGVVESWCCVVAHHRHRTSAKWSQLGRASVAPAGQRSRDVTATAHAHTDNNLIFHPDPLHCIDQAPMAHLIHLLQHLLLLKYDGIKDRQKRKFTCHFKKIIHMCQSTNFKMCKKMSF